MWEEWEWAKGYDMCFSGCIYFMGCGKGLSQ